MNIKSHLLRLGLIRGQPRTSLTAGSSAQASSLVGTPSTGPNSSRGGSERGSFQLPFDDPQRQVEFTFPSGMPSSISGKERSTYLYSVSNIGFNVIPRQCPLPIAFSRVPFLLRCVGTERSIRDVHAPPIGIARPLGNGGAVDLTPRKFQ